MAAGSLTLSYLLPPALWLRPLMTKIQHHKPTTTFPTQISPSPFSCIHFKQATYECFIDTVGKPKRNLFNVAITNQFVVTVCELLNKSIKSVNLKAKDPYHIQGQQEDRMNAIEIEKTFKVQWKMSSLYVHLRHTYIAYTKFQQKESSCNYS